MTYNPTQVNWELLNKALDQIEAKPNRWYQPSWLDALEVDEVPVSMFDKIEPGADASCGTTACLAGHAMLLSGQWRAVITNVDWDWDDDGTHKRLTGYGVALRNTLNQTPFQATVDEHCGLLPEYENFGAAEQGVAAKLLNMPTELAGRLFMMTIEMRPAHFTAWVRAQVNAWPTMVDVDDQRFASLMEPGFELVG